MRYRLSISGLDASTLSVTRGGLCSSAGRFHAKGGARSIGANEYVHPILAAGGPALTAGGIRVDRANGTLEHIVVDQDSKAYCPTVESLAEAVHARTAIGAPAGAIKTESDPPQCAAK